MVFAKFKIHDRAGYQRYVELATPIFMREGVIFHGNDDAPRAITPDMEADKVVLMEFRDKAHMKAFFSAQDYMAAAKIRDAAATISAIMFERAKPAIP